jgi:1-aminocyclopropane-1-carboxylate synthase
MTSTHRQHRLSLQRPASIPSIPQSPITISTRTSTILHSHLHAKVQSRDANGHCDKQAGDSDSEEEGGNQTLISCLSLSISSLLSQDDDGPVVSRFPQPAPAAPSSSLGTRAEQRRIYLGPKLSDRATGGPDAGPLIERFSCLFKDRACRVYAASLIQVSAGAYHLRIQLRDESKGDRVHGRG